MDRKGLAAAVVSVLTLSACAVAPPTEPHVMALPPAGKPFANFQAEDIQCRNYAASLSGGAAGAQQATNAAVGTAVVGTAIGAGVGAALGSLAGQVGTGAAVGATVGALAGGSAGASTLYAGEAELQQRYDMAYTQCMYANGDTVQSPPGGYRPGGYYGYGGYPYYGVPGAVVVGGPAIGVGWGWGWGWHRGWGGPGWHGGWHGGGWH